MDPSTPPPPIPPGPRPNSGLAVASLCCGIGGLLTCGVSSLVGVVLGHLALSDINRTGKGGRGLAIGGLITAYLLTGLMGVSVFGGMMLTMQGRKRQSELRAQVEALGAALQDFQHNHGAFPSDDSAMTVAQETGSTLSMNGSDVLNQLKAAGSLDGSVSDRLVVPRTAKGDWLYFPEGLEVDERGEVVLVSPAYGGESFAVFFDHSIGSLTYSEMAHVRDKEPIVIPTPRR